LKVAYVHACMIDWDWFVCFQTWISYFVLKNVNVGCFCDLIRTLSKMVFKVDYFANLLWIALYDYIKMYEWLLGVENDIYLNIMYFLLYLDREKLYVSVELCEEVDVSECIYVDWLRCCLWIHIC